MVVDSQRHRGQASPGASGREDVEKAFRKCLRLGTEMLQLRYPQMACVRIHSIGIRSLRDDATDTHVTRETQPRESRE